MNPRTISNPDPFPRLTGERQPAGLAAWKRVIQIPVARAFAMMLSAAVLTAAAQNDSRAVEATNPADLEHALLASKWSWVPQIPQLAPVQMTFEKDGTGTTPRFRFTWKVTGPTTVALVVKGMKFNLQFNKELTGYETVQENNSSNRISGSPVVPGKPLRPAPAGFIPSLASLPATPSAPSDAPTLSAPSRPSGELQEATAQLVKANRNNLVFVSGSNGSGSGFLARFGTGVFLFTNAHVAAGVKGAGFKTLQGETVQVGAPAVAVGHDIFRMQSTAAQPFEVMIGVDENAAIGDDIVVLGNAEGAGVINTITGKIVGLGPNLVEVDAPFKPGNSGSPIVHVKSGKIIGVATYLTIRKFDSATKQPVKEPIVRRFGYRLDSARIWQPVQWPQFLAQAQEMEAIEGLTDDLVKFLDALSDGKINSGVSTNPVIKTRIDQWLSAKSRGLSPRDRQTVDQNFISFLKVTCQGDITAARSHQTYDYFQRQLTEQERGRKEIADIFDNIIKDIQTGR